jgi:predicted nuclease of predicted toxin-antitoxin system
MGLSPRIAAWLRDAGHDAVHLLDKKLERLPDRQIFAMAARQRRVIVTCDLDFGRRLPIGK